MAYQFWSSCIHEIQTYGAIGWYVFPARYTSRSGLSSLINQATTDQDLIEEYFTDWPTSDVRVAVEESGLVAVQASRSIGEPPSKLRSRLFDVVTPTAFWQPDGPEMVEELLVFKRPPDFDVGSVDLGTGVHFVGKGFFTVPPNRNPADPYAATFRWSKGRAPDAVPPADLPDWLARRAAKRYRERRLSWLAQSMSASAPPLAG
jgi:hypothetical protein